MRRENRIDPSVEGILITNIDASSPYREIFPPGAVIETINRVPVGDLASAKRALREGRNLASYYYRGVRRIVTFLR